MPDALTLVCPIRGQLKAQARSADGLSPSEEALRVEAVKHLISLGYPPANIKIEPVIKRFGHGGRNSFRCDLAVLDVPVADIPSGDVEKLLAHTLILGEMKRDNADYDYVENTQVKPMLDFAAHDEAVGLYWDNVEQRVFWTERVSGVREWYEGSLPLLPRYGHRLAVAPLSLDDILPTDSLLDVFRRVEDILHAASVDPADRYEIMLQLLLAKLFDEAAHQGSPSDPLEFQDFTALGTSPAASKSSVESLLDRALGYYGAFLARSVPNRIGVDEDVLTSVTERAW